MKSTMYNRSSTVLIVAVSFIFLCTVFGGFKVQAAPAVSGPLCGVTGTVDSVEYQSYKSEFLGETVSGEYYQITFASSTIQVPESDSLDAFADILGWDRERLVEQRSPAENLAVCQDAYGPEGEFFTDTYKYSYYTEQPIQAGQSITALIQHGGDERLVGSFMYGVVVDEDTLEPSTDEDVEKRSLQLQLIDLLRELVSLLSLRS